MRTSSSTALLVTLLVCIGAGVHSGCDRDPDHSDLPGLGSGSGSGSSTGSRGPSFTVSSPGFANGSQLTMARGETLRFEVYVQYQNGHEQLTDDPISVSIAENLGEPHDPQLWLQDVAPRTLTNESMAMVTIVAGATARVDFHSLSFRWQCKHWQSSAQVNLEVFDRVPGWQPLDGSIGHNASPRSPALAGSATRLFAAVAQQRHFLSGGETASIAEAPVYATATRQGFTTLEPLVEHTPQVKGEYVSQPKLAVAPDGTLYTSRYSVSYTGDAELRVDRLASGGNTLAPVTTFRIANNQGVVDDSAIAVANDGRVWLAWTLSGRVYVAYLADDGALSPPEQVGSDQGQDVVALALVGGPEPHVIIAAENNAGDASVRAFSLRTTGATLRGAIGTTAPEIRALAAAIAPDATLLVSYQTVAAGNLAALHVYSLADGSDASTATELTLPAELASRDVT